jgi:hypothetical protein
VAHLPSPGRTLVRIELHKKINKGIEETGGELARTL